MVWTKKDINQEQRSVMEIRFLRDAKDEKFMRFFEIVQDAARKLGKVFFLWTEENNPLMTDELDGGDLSGWLVDESDAERFDAIWRESVDDIPDELDDTFCFAKWSMDDSGGISIRFE